MERERLKGYKERERQRERKGKRDRVTHREEERE